MHKAMRMALLGLACLVAAGGAAAAAPEFVLVDLADWVTNDGISTDQWPGDQNFDDGGWGFPAEELPDGDFEVAWDDRTPVPFKGLLKEDGWGNNIEAFGDVIELPPGRYAGVWLLAANHHGATEGAAITFTYKDGSTSEGSIFAGDWCGAPAGGEKMVIRPTHRHDARGDTGPSCGMWLLPRFTVDPARELVSLTLPDEDRFHVFGITLEK